jgi:hypothetical protein
MVVFPPGRTNILIMCPTVPILYKSSQTMEKDVTILELRKKNKQLYIDMWGGEPEREKFKTPFNK